MTSNLHSKTVRIGELGINYFMGGQGEPLIIIHGGADGARAWLKNAMELTKYYSVYVPDLPGFGHSQSMNDNFYFLEFASFLENFANNLGLRRFHLVGHSLGGGIALHYALKSPHKINSLVLVSSICLGNEIALWARLLSHPTFCRPVGKAAISILNAVRWLVKLFYTPFEFPNPLSPVKMDLGISIMTLKGQTIVLVNRLSELLVPTLLVWGAKDGIVPVSHAYAASQLIPNCQLHVFEDCGHNSHRQRVHEFSQLLIKFLG